MRRALVPWLWAAVLGAALLFSGGRWLAGGAVQTSLFSMFPSETQTEALDIALKHASKAFEHSLLVVVEGQQLSQVKQAAQQITELTATIDDVTVVGAEQRFEFIETLFRYRHQLLTEADSQTISSGNSDALTASSLRRLYSPAGISGQAFVNDPWQTFERYMLAIVDQNTFRYQDDLLIGNQDQKVQALMQLTLASSAFSSDSLGAIATLNDILASVSEQHQVVVYRTGAGFFSASAMNKATSEVSIIGGGALLLVVVVVMWVFANTKPLVMTLLSIISGVIFGLAATLAWFGEIHVLAIVMGSSLIGLSFDYSFHYLSYRACHDSLMNGQSVVTKLRTALLAGVVSSSIAYSFLLFANLPVLNQMAVFSVFGLFGALATVLFWYPFMRVWNTSPRPLRVASGLMRITQRLCHPKRVWWVALIYCGIAVYAWHAVETNDDVRMLQSPDPALVNDEQRIKALTQSFGGSDWLIVVGESAERVAQSEEQLTRKLDQMIDNGQLQGYVASSQWIPSIAKQTSNWKHYQRLVAEQSQKLASLASLDTAPTVNPFEPLTAHQRLTGIPALSSQLDDGRHFALVQLSGMTGEIDSHMLDEGQFYINYVDDIGAMLGHYRERVSRLLIVAIAAVVAIVGVYFGWRALPRLMAAPLLAVVIAAALPAALGQPLTLFHALGLFLIFGIGIDYSLFLHCHGDSEHTILAVFVAGISSLLSFGLMALSSNYAIASFGLTVGIGILSSWLVAAIVLLNANSTKHAYSREQA
ncbi:MMPL family transporter [Vibrio sp. 10N]|uniref:MMPL family transporter n=1 Tax=Vibrio sp. 10N TaxID=3058938 RepID=UPI00281339E7|nr:MMPL family transporter [Vibrio sp. 10N]